MKQVKQMEKNIQVNYYLSFVMSVGITSMWVLYLGYKGMNLLEIGLLEGLFHICSLLFEIPSGAIADTYGFRKTLLLGRVSGIISALLLIFTQSFWLLALGFIFSAISYNLNSGTNEALVYESLKALTKEKKYLKIAAKINILYEFADGIGIMVAGLFIDTYFEGVYWIQIGLCLLAVVLILQLTDPTYRHHSSTTVSYRKTLIEAYQVVKGSSELLYLMFFFAILEGLAATFFFYFQAYLQEIAFKGYLISLLVVVSCLVQAVGSKLAPKIEQKLGQNGILLFMPIVLAVLLFFSGVAAFPYVLVCYIAINTLVAVLAPIATTYFNQLIPSPQRATLISVSSMVYSLMMILLFPAMGGLADLIGFRQCFILMSGILFLILFLQFFIRKKA